MKNVFIVTWNNFAQDGIIAFLYEWIKNSSSYINYIWYFPGTIKNNDLYNVFLNYNVKLISGNHLESTQNTYKNKYQRYKRILCDIRHIMLDNEFDVIHINTGSPLNAASTAWLAKKCNVKIRIVHSHNTDLDNSLIKKLCFMISRKIIKRTANRYVACSTAAFEFMFHRQVDTVNIINNCIDSKKFVFSSEARNNIRKKYNMENSFVIGHIGRFVEQKNHKFLIDIFYEVVKKNDNAKLLLIGMGELEKDVKNQIKEYNLSDHVILTGEIENVNDFLCAMDVFVLPSLYEGLGIVVIEAQAASLKVICSDQVPKETNITELIKYIPLSIHPRKWAEEILSCNNKYKRIDMSEQIKQAGFDTYHIRNMLRDLYYYDVDE